MSKTESGGPSKKRNVKKREQGKGKRGEKKRKKTEKNGYRCWLLVAPKLIQRRKGQRRGQTKRRMHRQRGLAVLEGKEMWTG